MDRQVTLDWIDEDGYPSDAAIKKITEWPCLDGLECLLFVKSLWRWPNYAEKAVDRDGATHFQFATGGWSGNEELICALKSNRVLYSMFWKCSMSGGWHHYAVPHLERHEKDA